MYRKSFSNFRSRQHRFSNRPNGHHKPNGFAKPRSLPEAQYIKKAAGESQVENYQLLHQFADFQLDERLKANIINRGYQTPTPIQDQTIPQILSGKDVVGIANTGTGKTAAFLLPLIHKIINDRTQKILIMAPTRELAMQIEEELRAFGKGFNILSVLCIGGANINMQIMQLKQNPAVVIGTPGRLKDLINRRLLHLGQFQNIVLDEVDRMVDIGFIKDIKFIISMLPKKRQSLFFSATLNPEINSIMQAFLTNPVMISVKEKEAPARIEQDIIRVKSKEEKLVKLNTLLRQADFKKVLVFGRTKWNVERLAKTLQQNGFTVASIHGNKSQNQRVRALTQFKQNRLQVLVATDIAARGLDIADVSHVINYDEPSTQTDYVHRIGRTGRANKIGKALTFVM